MKRHALGGLLAATLLLAGPASARGAEDPGCEGSAVTALLVDKVRAAPEKASATLRYCAKARGTFRGELSLSGFAGHAAYLLTLNGVSGKPGNQTLRERCKVVAKDGGSEGYCDIRTIATDAGGAAQERVDHALPPGTYEVKVLLKNADRSPLYQVVSLSDGVRFEVLGAPSPSIELLSPEADAQVGLNELVKGRVSDPTLGVFVLVHPLLTPLWFVQPIPSPPNRNGSWHGIAYFGTESKGVGELFEVVAIATEDPDLLEEGQQLSSSAARKLLAGHLRTDVVPVKRTR